jgi:hypothetical protein
VAQGHDGVLVTAAHAERLELRLEYGPRTTGTMSELAEQAPDIEITFAHPSGFALARRLMVAEADADPGGQPIGAAEGTHIGADLNQQHGGANEIDTGQGLQQRQGVLLLLQCFQQPGIEAGGARLDFLDMAHQFVKHEAVIGGQFPLQGIEDFLTAGLSRRLASRSMSRGGSPA